jgi:signal transduction histidine kinase/CheY-like chemotaxis protein/HPt (histidine-containing phosphotransfer) domain-containing protein
MRNPDRNTLRQKLLRIVVGVLSMVAITTLSAVAWLNWRTERDRLHDMETQVRTAIVNKARGLVDNHALALRGLVADNAFTDVQQLVERAVAGDKDIVYGVFVSADGSPWAYASPTTRAMTSANPQERLARWSELSIPENAWAADKPSRRRIHLFGQDIFEVSRPVVDNQEVLGMVRYGFSAKPLRDALIRVRSESRAALRSMLVSITLAAFACTLLGIFLVRRASSRIVRPLVLLTDAAERVAEGKTGVRVEVEAEGELAVLAHAFNHMQQANEDAMRKLSDAMEAALEASRLKSEFLANMSHEIRTPMNGVIGMIRLILKMPLESKLRRYAETVDASAGALMTIINDVLDFSKMEAGKYTLQSVPFDPGGVLQEVAELFSGRACDKGLELAYRRDGSVPQVVTGDPDRYRQILTNLVGNAIKFSERGEIFVELTVDRADQSSYVLRTTVQDTGIGIGAEDQARLFNAFSQVDGSMVRRYGGTGLGLAICKRLTEMMGGEIGVTSELGLGSTFTFTIRVEHSTAPTRATPVGLPVGRRALVVEASKRWCRIIEESMLAWGLVCDVFEDGRPALERVAEVGMNGRYDVVVIGAQLRDLGIEDFVKSLRAIAAAKDVPLIVLTQLGTSATLSEVEKEVTAQVAKPLRLSDLYDCLVTTFAGTTFLHSDHRVRTQNSRRCSKPILVVDDNEVNQFVAVEQVQDAGYEVEVACNGEQALARIRDKDYAAVLMDCQMPVMDGYTAARAIRDLEGNARHTPIIALTAHAMVGERDKVLAAGMDDYLSKPLRAQSLERMLERYVARAGEKEDVAEEAPKSIPELDMTLDRSERLSSLFITRVPDNLGELDAAVAAGDARRIREKAHKLKGSCLALGAGRMAEEAEALQHEAEHGQLENAAGRAQTLREQYGRAAALLREEMEHARTSPSQRPPRPRSDSVSPPV